MRPATRSYPHPALSNNSSSNVNTRRKNSNKKKATFKQIQQCMMIAMIAFALLAFVLSRTIMSQHRAEHQATMERHYREVQEIHDKIIKQHQQKNRQQEQEQEQQIPKQGETEEFLADPPKDEEEEEEEEEGESREHSIDVHHEEDYRHEEEDPHLHIDEEEGMTVFQYELPTGFQTLLQRSKTMKSTICDGLPMEEQQTQKQAPEQQRAQHNNSTADELLADLPPFGIIKALENYSPKTVSEQDAWRCRVPPSTECQETQLTVVFLGYRPDRLQMFRNQVRKMIHQDLNQKVWNGLIKEVLLVWNGDRELAESHHGKMILRWAKDPNIPFRISYPLKEGFPNDLMNRYHPRFDITTKGILFYDDDGPFYSVAAITSGFELWKRNSNAQIGAMARRLDLSSRGQAEKDAQQPHDEFHWISHCRDRGDTVRYNFQHFAQSGANMALPSGSFLHRDMMCWIWHPALEEIRQFVRAHPVHPDDVTVSTIVSHVTGRAPKVYSRRINKAKEEPGNTTNGATGLEEDEMGEDNGGTEQAAADADAGHRRRLLWDDGNHGVWARKRESAVNSLIGYFGGINSGSDGWCHETPYHDTVNNVCKPDQADAGMLPWMSADHTPLECPQTRTITTKQYSHGQS